MSLSLKLAIASLVIGGILGLVVLVAAWAAGRPRKLPYWAAGTAWGVLVVLLLLSDCSYPGRPAALARAAYPLYYAGLFGFPAALVWKQRPWATRWLVSQLLLLVTVVPAFLAAVASAFCSLQ